MDSMLRVAVGDSTGSPDSGHRPPLANEAAMAAPDSQVISVEVHWGQRRELVVTGQGIYLFSVTNEETDQIWC